MNWNEETDVEIPFCQDLEKTGWSVLVVNKYRTPAELPAGNNPPGYL